MATLDLITNENLTAYLLESGLSSEGLADILMEIDGICISQLDNQIIVTVEESHDFSAKVVYELILHGCAGIFLENLLIYRANDDIVLTTDTETTFNILTFTALPVDKECQRLYNTS